MIRLPNRQETPEQWDNNKVVNQEIQHAWNASKENLDSTFDSDILAVTEQKICKASDYSSIPYGKNGESTLEKSGCAAFCFHQGIRTRGELNDIISIAKLISEKGYYYPGRGTYHNLFDHYGIRRATHVNEIMSALSCGHIVTLLVDNKLYGSALAESHFINIVGKERENFIVDDSRVGRTKVELSTVIAASRVAWIW